MPSADCTCWVSTCKVVTSAVITWLVFPVGVFGCPYHDGLEEETSYFKGQIYLAQKYKWKYMFQLE